MHACEMTPVYLRGALSTRSVVWAEFEYFSPKFINILMQLCKNFLQNFKNYGSYLLFQKPLSLAQPCFGSSLPSRLSATLSFGVKMTLSRVILSMFSDLRSQIATLFAKPQESLPVGYIFYFFQLLEICVLH